MTATVPPLRIAADTSKPGMLAAVARRLLLAQLRKLGEGRLTVREGPHTLQFGTAAVGDALDIEVNVHDPRFYAAVAFGGSVGAAESYAHGDWSASDLTGVVRLFLRNRRVLDGMETGLARLGAPARHLLHWLNRNTRGGSRRNIEAHYDLGNDFFALFLDETMTYSSAVFERAGMSLAEAQVAKIDSLCRRLALGPGDRLLEIGSGWGAFAIHAARQYGCRVTTTTISPAQYSMARERIRQAGLEDRIELKLCDYRDLTGRYDKLVSVEMIEAVGHQYYDTFFRCTDRLLEPGGRMALQAITIADQYYEAARRSVDFIQRYIFPGSTIPSVTALVGAATRASTLRLTGLEDIGPHYATTLRLWRERFNQHRAQVLALGHTETFCRLWEYYFSYCEGGFLERALGDAHMVFEKPAYGS